MTINLKAIKHLLDTSTSDTGWLSNVEVQDTWYEYSAVELSTGETIDVGQAVEEVLLIATPLIRAQIAADIRALKTEADLMGVSDLVWNRAIEDAARIAEEGN